MADVARGTLLLIPKIDNLEATISRQLGASSKASTEAGAGVGASVGTGFSGGLVKSGALIGAFSSLTSKAMDAIGSHVGSAAARFDTLNNYPKTMVNLGYGADEAEASISKMSDRLQTMPTTLDSMVSVVQGLVTSTGDLDKATDAGLALNDMLVASGSSASLTGAAMEQFRQMLAKGEPEMQDWKSLTQAMPGQMDQLAKAMLGPTANANDLYAALGGGGADATLSMDDLLNAMIRLDTDGGGAITSFKDQAETAAGGVQTAAENMGNAITKGITGTMDAIGRDNISGLLGDVKNGINDAFGGINDVVGKAMPNIKRLYDGLKQVGPEALTMVASFAGVKAVGGTLADVGSKMSALANNTKGLKGANEILGTSFTPVGLAITAVAAVAAVGITAYTDWKTKTDNLAKATQGLEDVVGDTTALGQYTATLSDVGTNAESSAMSVDELAESTSKHVDQMRQNTEAAETQIAQLNTAQQIIDNYAGQTDLSTEAQGKLEWAIKLVNDQLGISIDASNVASDSYEDQNGNVMDLTDSIDELIDKKKEEARVNALTDNLTLAYKSRSEAASTLAGAQKDYNDRVEWFMDAVPGITRADAERRASSDKEGQALQSAQDQYDSATGSVNNLETAIGTATEATSESATEWQRWGASTSELFHSQIGTYYGQNIGSLTDDLQTLGASTEDLSNLSEDQLLKLAQTYDGTTQSIVGLLDSWGVHMDETAQQTAQASATISDALSSMGATDALSAAGVDVDNFSDRLAAAGVSTEQLNSVGSSNLAALAEATGGNMDAMVWAVQHYNDQPILDKDGNIAVDQAQLVDAQGRVWTWNGTDLQDKDGNVSTEDQQLIDSQGRVYTWNGSTLNPLRGSATVTGNLSSALATVQAWNSSTLGDKWATMTVQQKYTTLHTPQNARGGFVVPAHADGGYLNGIVTRPTLTNVGWVGEDGAEMVTSHADGGAIVPLTNRRYSQPMVDLLADGLAERSRGASSPLDYDRLSDSMVRALSGLALYVDGKRLVGATAEHMSVELARMQSSR